MLHVVIAKVGVRFLVKPEFFQILSPPLRLFIHLVVHFFHVNLLRGQRCQWLLVVFVCALSKLVCC